jgi:predicted phage tail protein
MPGERRWSLMQKQARETLQAMHEEMQGYHEERTEDWQESEKGEALQARMDALESIIADLDALTEA